LQWLGFGLPVNPEGLDRDQTLGLRSIIPYELPYAVKAKVRSSVSLLLTKNTVLFTCVQAVYLFLRLSEGISDSITAQPLAC